MFHADQTHIHTVGVICSLLLECLHDGVVKMFKDPGWIEDSFFSDDLIEKAVPNHGHECAGYPMPRAIHYGQKGNRGLMFLIFHLSKPVEIARDNILWLVDDEGLKNIPELILDRQDGFLDIF